MNPFLVREAIASVALEHPEGCICRVCSAAHGDAAELIEIYTLLATQELRDREMDEPRRRDDVDREIDTENRAIRHIEAKFR